MRHARSVRPPRASRAIAVIVSLALAIPFDALIAAAQPGAPDAVPAAAAAPSGASVPQGEEAKAFSAEQLDALLAPIALYPDALLTQMLMSTTEPLQLVQAKRWLDDPAHASLTGQALETALAAESWDPSVKSLVPFPTVIAMLNSNLDWTQQLGYAFAVQQADVLDSIQRLRRQAQEAGTLKTTPQQVVANEADAITIQPANPETVYVPVYNPSVAFGTWPYPSYPPVYVPPPPGVDFGAALATGLAFGAGVAVVAGLWNLARPNWGWRGPGYGGVNVNVNRWNSVNVNRPPLASGGWRPPPPGRPGGWNPGRPPPGPVGAPVRAAGLSANAIGRPSVNVNNSLVNRPARPPGPPPALQRPGNENRPNMAQRPGGGGGNTPSPPQRPNGGERPGAPQRPNGGQRPSVPPRPSGGERPNLPQRPNGGSQPAPRPTPGPAPRPANVNRPQGGAFASMNEGRQAGDFGARGGQSRQIANQDRAQAAARGRDGGGPRGGGPHGGGGGGGHIGGGRNR